MKNYLSNRTTYEKHYGEAFYRKYMKDVYGIKTPKMDDVDLLIMRKNLADWQSNEDNDALTETSITYTTWKPIAYADDPDALEGGGGFSVDYDIHQPHIFKLNYNYGNGEGNIIEVNTGGCVTRINLNPAITINGGTYTHHQVTPATVWTIVHNMGFVPNVLLEDEDGNEIEGMVEPINSASLTVTFSQAVSGYAYLS